MNCQIKKKMQAVDSFCCSFSVMTLLLSDMTFSTDHMIVCCHVYEQKTSCYDKNVTTPYPQSESAGYVKVRLIAAHYFVFYLF